MGSSYLWGRSIQVMGGDVVIGRSIYKVVVIDGSLYSRFYGMLGTTPDMYTVQCMGFQRKIAFLPIQINRGQPTMYHACSIM